MTGKIENIDITNDSVETTVNNQLEGLFNKFLNSDKKDELKKIDFSIESRKTKTEELFDNWLKENPSIIDNLIDIDDNSESEIETEVKEASINLNILNNEVEIKQELNALKTEIDTPTTNIPELDKALTEIENQPDASPEAKKTLKEYLKKGDIMGAITELLDFLSDAFGGLFNQAGSIDEQYSTLANLKNIDFIKMTKEKIQEEIEKITKKMVDETDINKKLSITYVLSTFKKQLALKNNSKLNEYKILEKNITKGTVLLLNKQTSILDGGLSVQSVTNKLGSSALENYDDSRDTSFSHSVIVTQTNPIKITHSTMDKFGEKGSGVQEIPFQEYLNSYPSVNVLALDMPQENKNKALSYAQEKLDKQTEYDGGFSGVAVSDQVGGKFGSDNAEKVNCVELIAEGLGEDKIKNISDPNDFLKSDILKPTYMTTISSSV